MTKSNDAIQAQLIAARRNQILDAATTIFAEKGFQRATIRDVAKVAGIADGTIYNYFENKTALLLGILNRLNETERREEDFAQGLQMNVADFMRAYIKQRLDVMSPKSDAVFQVLLSEIMVNQELRDLYYRQVIEPTFTLGEPYFNQWVAGSSLAEEDVPLAMRAIAAMMLGLITLRIMGDTTLDEHWGELPDFLTRLILNGIQAE